MGRIIREKSGKRNGTQENGLFNFRNRALLQEILKTGIPIDDIYCFSNKQRYKVFCDA